MHISHIYKWFIFTTAKHCNSFMNEVLHTICFHYPSTKFKPNMEETNEKYILLNFICNAAYNSGIIAQTTINTKSKTINKTRSTGTVHTSAKARLTSVTIWICIRDPYRHQHSKICSLVHCQPSLKISCKSVQQFLHKVANRQTNRQTTMITYPPWRR